MRTLWILNHYSHPPDLPGGTRHFDLASELAGQGYDVTIFSSAFSHKLRRKARLLKGEPWAIEEVEGVRFVWLPSFAYQDNNWRRMLNMVEYAWRAYWLGRRLPNLQLGVPSPDIVLGCSVHLFAVLAGYHLSRHFQARFLMEVRDLWPQTFLDMGLWREGQLQVRFFRWLESYLYQRAERIVTLSPLTRDYLANYSSEWAGKVACIPNGTRVARFSQPERKLEDAEGPLKAMYLGAMGVTNGLDLVLEAAQIIERTEPNLLEFVLVGDGPEKARLQQRASDLALHNVRFQDAVPRAQVPHNAGQADLLLLVQKEVLYGSSNKLYDYMAAAKPIVFAITADHNRPLEEAQCGVYASPENAGDLAEKIIQVAHMSAAERRAMGARGRAFVAQHHDYAVLAQELVAVLEGLGVKPAHNPVPSAATGQPHD